MFRQIDWKFSVERRDNALNKNKQNRVGERFELPPPHHRLYGSVARWFRNVTCHLTLR